jgi:hypothetical protein
VSTLWCPRTRQIYRLAGLHPPETVEIRDSSVKQWKLNCRPRKACCALRSRDSSLLRDSIKCTLCIYRTEGVDKTDTCVATSIVYHTPYGLQSKLLSFYAVTPDRSDRFLSNLIPVVLGSFVPPFVKHNQKLSLIFERIEATAKQARLFIKSCLHFLNYLGFFSPCLFYCALVARFV